MLHCSARRILSDVKVNVQASSPNKFITRREQRTAPAPIPDLPLRYVRRNDPYRVHVLEACFIQYAPLPATLFPLSNDDWTAHQQRQQQEEFSAFNGSLCSDVNPYSKPFTPANHDVSFDLPWNANTSLTPVKEPTTQPTQRPSPNGRRVLRQLTDAEDIIVAATPPPTVVTADSLEGAIALVAFTVHSRWFAVDGGELTAIPSPGTYVVVPGDWGLDVGIIVDVSDVTRRRTNSQWAVNLPLWREALACPPPPSRRPSEHIHRKATCVELEGARLARVNQPFLVESTQEQVDIFARQEKADQLIRTLQVRAVERQMDGRKVTVYFSADTTLRIADLAAFLYRHFRCRVWLHQINGVKLLPVNRK